MVYGLNIFFFFPETRYSIAGILHICTGILVHYVVILLGKMQYLVHILYHLFGFRPHKSALALSVLNHPFFMFFWSIRQLCCYVWDGNVPCHTREYQILSKRGNSSFSSLKRYNSKFFFSKFLILLSKIPI